MKSALIFFAVIVCIPCWPQEVCCAIQSPKKESVDNQEKSSEELQAELNQLFERAEMGGAANIANVVQIKEVESSAEERIEMLEKLQKEGGLRIGDVRAIPPKASSSSSGDNSILILAAILIGGFVAFRLIAAFVEKTTKAPKVKLSDLQERLSNAKSIDDTEMEEFLMAVTHLERANRWDDALILLKDIRKVLRPESEHWRYVAKQIEELEPAKSK